ncbi:MAG: tetratricopeptide repeat protein [Nitrospiraceae bacterium]|nr:tetratricopeptide repeat protein [Nitrospiraceae bacterium]
MQKLERAFGGDAGWRTLLISAGFVFLVAFAQYSYSLGNDFVWDAKSVITEDPSIREVRSLPSFFTRDFWSSIPMDGKGQEYLKYYRPLIKILHLAEYSVFGPVPTGYNAVNVSLNALVAVLAMLVVSGMTGSLLTGVIAAVLYAVNPAGVEAVSWVYSDAYVLTALFSLACLLSYMHRRRMLSLLCLCLALLSHESAVLLPLVLIAYETLVRRSPLRYALRKTVPFLAVTAVFLGIRRAVVGPIPVTDLPFVTLANTIAVIVKRAVKIFFVPDAAVVIYPREVFPGLTGEVIVSYAAAALMLLAGGYLWVRNRVYFFWYAWFFLWLVPVMNAGSIGEYMMAEKSVYLPSLGFCVLIALLAVNAGRARTAALAAVLLFSVTHAYMTFSRLKYWSDDVTYMEKALEFTPDFFPLNYALGQAYAFRGDYDRSIIRYQRVIEVNPRMSNAYCNLGNIFYMRGENDRAVAEWEKAIEADPDNPLPYYNVGMELEKRGRQRDALGLYRKYLSLAPDPPADVAGHIRGLEAMEVPEGRTGK